MSVIVHKKKSVKDMITLSQELEDQLMGATREEAKLIKEAHIREQLEKNASYNTWDTLEFLGYKNDVDLVDPDILVSIRGQIAYDVDDEMHVTTGTPNDGYIQANIPVVSYDGSLGISRLVACTFLAVPDKFKDVSPHDLTVIHLNGDSTQTHFANLEWDLNVGDLETKVVEETIELLNTDLEPITENE